MSYGIIIDTTKDTPEDVALMLEKIAKSIKDGAKEGVRPSWELQHEYDCHLCEDTGEVDEDEVDESGNVARGTITTKCICRLGEY